MICPTCRGTGQTGDLRYAHRHRYQGPCLTCNGTGRAHCCDGECQQPEPRPVIHPNPASPEDSPPP